MRYAITVFLGAALAAGAVAACGGGGGNGQVYVPDGQVTPDGLGSDADARSEVEDDSSACTPRSCFDQNASCGTLPNGCGESIDCGSCPPGQTCGGGGTPNVCGVGTCTPTTCEAEGAGCGPLSDGCGSVVQCGDCPAGQGCGAGGVPNTCAPAGCQPEDCDSLGADCGKASDGCGGVLECGKCPPGHDCGAGGAPNVCGVGTCTPTTCEAEGAECGSIGDGCGDLLDCGACQPPETCGGGGEPSICGQPACAPTTCEVLGLACGGAPDGCGHTLSCGTCTVGKACVEGACVAQDGCTPGAIQCAEAGNGFHGCGWDEVTGEDAWSKLVPCFPGQACESGACDHEACVQTEVIVLLDRSSSMQLFELWEWVRAGVLKAIQIRDGFNLFGFRQFPSGEACGVGDVVPIKKNNYSAISAGITPPSETSSTPIEAALTGLRNAYGDPNDGEAVILVTDGDETCGSADGAVREASKLLQRGIRTYVIAVGDIANTTFLDGVAEVGGTGASRQVADGEALEAAFAAIFDELGACNECDAWPERCEGDILRHCVGAVPEKVDCSGKGATCGAQPDIPDDAACLLPAGGDCTAGGIWQCDESDDLSCVDGVCCKPDCTGKTCGSDGCGGICGVCAPPGGCTDGQCSQVCELGPWAGSNADCEFWAVDVSNISSFADSPWAIRVANLGDEDATVSVFRQTSAGTEPVEQSTTTIEAGGDGVITLPEENPGVGGAYVGSLHIGANQPIVVTQFNPSTAADVYSNDATILLGSRGLGTAFVIPSLRELAIGDPGEQARGSISIAATQPETTVTVLPTGAAFGGDGPMAAGGVYDFALAPQEVLNVFSNGDGVDITGTTVLADKPVAVFAGHDAAITGDQCCADHLEHQVPPKSALGTSYVAGKSAPRGGEPDYWRVVAGENGTLVSFSPALADAATLDRGEFVEVVTPESFVVEASKPVLLVQYLASSYEVVDPPVGTPCSTASECYAGYDCTFGADLQMSCQAPICSTDAGCPGGHSCECYDTQCYCEPVGDPAMIILPPVDAWRSEYVFATGGGYTQHHVTVTAPAGASVSVDGVAVAGWAAIPGTSWVVGRAQIDEGRHTVRGDQPVGLSVYGYSNDVSYGFAGGMSLP